MRFLVINNNKAFSLLEMALAISIASVVMSLGIGLTQSAYNLSASIDAKANYDNAIALTQLARDLRGSRFPTLSQNNHVLTVTLWGDEIEYRVITDASGKKYLAKIVNGTETKRIASNVDSVVFTLLGGNGWKHQLLGLEIVFKNYVSGKGTITKNGNNIITQSKYFVCLRNSWRGS